MNRGLASETVRLRIRNVANAVLVSGQACQGPKDALNEFVSDAADGYAEAGIRGGRIRIHLRRNGRRPLIAIEDDGRGMTPERLREVARGLFQSVEAGTSAPSARRGSASWPSISSAGAETS